MRVTALRDHPPEQQGLRPFHYFVIVQAEPFLRDHPPEQQGLRPFLRIEPADTPEYLRDHPPEQQGLRLIFETDIAKNLFLRDHPPEQQGLRHFFSFFSVFFQAGSETILQNNKD